VGLAFGKRRPRGSSARYDLGIEWSPLHTGLWGRPFAAVDLDFRPEQDYTANVTVQAGWLWRDPLTRHSIRVALEYYNGKSPYGKFLDNSEDFLGFSLLYDW